MATQKEAVLDVLRPVKDYVLQFQTPTKKHEKAKATVLGMLNKRIQKLESQLDVYFANLENKRKNEPK